MTTTASPARRTVGIIPCSGAKADHAAPARDLYTGQMFRHALAAAEAQCDVVFVMSARHGIVALDTILEPYDTTIADALTELDVQLTAQVAGITDADDVYGFLPAAYRALVVEGLSYIGVNVHDVFEADAGIGHQRATCTAARTV